MNVNEYGLTHNFSVSYDLSGFVGLSMTYTRPDKTTFTVNNPAVQISATPYVAASGTFAANQYARYIFANGDLNSAGVYTARLTYTDASKRLISDVVSFTVNA